MPCLDAALGSAGMIAPLNCLPMHLRTSSDSYAATRFFTRG
jgi:hypothetical protein